MSGFSRATKTTAKARLGVYGVSGSGKTMTSLILARALVGAEGKIALVDTEGGSASKYADLFEFDQNVMRKPFHPERFAKAVDAAVAGGYDVVIIDGASPFWEGEGGVLTIVDAAKKRGGGWADGTPAHNKLVEAILTCPIHIVVTMRAKAETIPETGQNGKVTFRKVGVKMVQRDGLDYEFDVLLYLDLDNSATVEKSRKPNELGVRVEPGQMIEWADGFREWLDAGVPAPPPPVAATAEPAPAAASEPAAAQADPPPASDAPPAPPVAAPQPAPAGDPTGGMAPPAAPAEGTTDARRATRARITASLARLAELDSAKDWPGMMRERLPEWYPGRTAEPELSDAEAEGVADRIEATVQLLSEAATPA